MPSMLKETNILKRQVYTTLPSIKTIGHLFAVLRLQHILAFAYPVGIEAME